MRCRCGNLAQEAKSLPPVPATAEWEFKKASSQTSAPRLIKQETQPPTQSSYVNISLGTESPARPMTGIFVPSGYRPRLEVDLILYLHGYKVYGYNSRMSIDSYWDKARVPYFPLREGLNDAGENVILVAPTLGPKSQAGWLLGPNGLDRYLDQVLQTLMSYGPYRGSAQSPTIGNIILACHSGGGNPMRRLALSTQRYSTQIRECWGFDCLYNGGDPDLWATWASQDPRRRLYVYYLRSTERLSKKLQAKNLPNVVVRQSSRGHNWVPINHWGERIRNATVFRNSSESTLSISSAREFEVLDGELDGAQPSDHNLLESLRQFAIRPIGPTVDHALRIVKLISAYCSIPWRVCYTILNHEGGVRLFKRRHPDGAMQTTSGVRRKVIPRIPRALKLVLLGLQSNDPSDNRILDQRIMAQFRDQLPIQIATGIQELNDNLRTFNGYVALAFQAYNAGTGWAYYTVTQGKAKSRPRGVDDLQWENMCRFGASLLHQSPHQVRIEQGRWQCDKNIPAWFSHVPVYDRQSGLQLVAFKYLRSVTERVSQHKPAIPCTTSNHRRRDQGAGPIIPKTTHAGSLDKLYNPKLLGPLYYRAVASDLTPINDDGLPLKAVNGRLIKKPPISTINQEIWNSFEDAEETAEDELEWPDYEQNLEFADQESHSGLTRSVPKTIWRHNTDLDAPYFGGNFNFLYNGGSNEALITLNTHFSCRKTYSEAEKRNFIRNLTLAVDVWDNAAEVQVKDIHGNYTDRIKLRFRLNIVQNPKHSNKKTDIHPTASRSTWFIGKGRETVMRELNVFIGSSRNVLVHELGHVWGLLDEYDARWIEKKFSLGHVGTGSPLLRDKTAIMNEGYMDERGNTGEFRGRYFKHFGRAILNAYWGLKNHVIPIQRNGKVVARSVQGRVALLKRNIAGVAPYVNDVMPFNPRFTVIQVAKQ